LEGTINCATSKRFVDCLTGFEYFSSEAILDSFGNPILPDYVYGGLLNGVQSCFIYVDLVDNISGVDKIEITAEFGPENEGSCIFCNFPTPTPTPSVSPTPTLPPYTTPTPTPTSTPPTPINPICQSCDVGFDFYDINPISVISVGVVTASCDPSITDYVIEWYGPGVGSTNLVFTSGLGTDYLGDYLYTHPLTGTSEVPVVAGVYTPIISKIKINGVEYTNVNCFDSTTVDVNALTCINGTGSDLPQYSHKQSFNAIVNQTPQPVSTTYILDPLKPYFAFRFEAEAVYDTLEITLYGSSYSGPIILENISQGVDLNETNFDLNLLPKKAKPALPTNLSKVLNLSNFDLNSGDYLEITIRPNTTNNNTNWRFYCECLESFNCDVCYDTNITQPFKIIESSITVSTPDSCGLVNINFDLSACTDSDFNKYILPNLNGYYYNTVYNDDYYNSTNCDFGFLSPEPQNQCSLGGPFFPPNCNTPSTSTITYDKTIIGGEGLISMSFTDYNDFLAYWDNWESMYLSYSGNPTDCTDIDFYRYFVLSIPLAVGSDNCGDTTGFQNYYIHPSAIVTSGGTGPWTMSITMPTISSCITFSSCDLLCNIFKDYSVIDNVNNSSTATTNNISIVNNTGSRLITPIREVNTLSFFSTVYSGGSLNFLMSVPKYINETIPYSGSPLTLVPSLSAETCSFNNWTEVPTGVPSKNLNFYKYDAFYYYTAVINPLNHQDFEIFAPVLSNGTWAGYPSPPTLNLIYRYVGGSVTFIDNNYFV
jgi:hypothetical protein